MRSAAILSILTATAALGAVLGACAPPVGPSAATTDAGEPRRCFRVDRVRNFRATADQTLYLRTSRTDVFETRALGACQNLDWAMGVALIGPGVSTVCTGDLATVVPRDTGVAPGGPCRIQVVRQLTPQQIAALPDRDRP